MCYKCNSGEGDGTPFQYSYLETPMDGKEIKPVNPKGNQS